MKLTIIVDDTAVYVDGECITGIDMEGMPEGVRVVQWNGVRGWEEMRETPEGDFVPNVPLEDVEKYQFMVDRFNAAKAEQVEE